MLNVPVEEGQPDCYCGGNAHTPFVTSVVETKSYFQELHKYDLNMRLTRIVALSDIVPLFES
jgi:hypothetical protein